MVWKILVSLERFNVLWIEKSWGGEIWEAYAGTVFQTVRKLLKTHKSLMWFFHHENFYRYCFYFHVPLPSKVTFGFLFLVLHCVSFILWSILREYHCLVYSIFFLIIYSVKKLFWYVGYSSVFMLSVIQYILTQSGAQRVPVMFVNIILSI